MDKNDLDDTKVFKLGPDPEEETIEVEIDLEGEEETKFEDTKVELETIVFDENLAEENKEEEQKEAKPKKEKKDNIFKKMLKKWKTFKKRTKILIIIGLVLLLAGIGVGVWFLIQNKEAEIEAESNIVIRDNFIFNNGVLTFLNEDDEPIGTYECENNDPDLCFVAMELDNDNFDVERKLFEDETPVGTRSHIYFDHYVFVFDNKDAEDKEIFLWDIKEEEKLTTYLGVKSYETDENYLVLKNKNDKYGLWKMTEDGLDSVLNDTHDYMGIIVGDRNDYVVLKNNNRWSIVNYANRVLLRPIQHEIKNADDRFVTISDGTNYGLLRMNGQSVIGLEYDFIQPLQNHVIVVKDQGLRVLDFNGNKMFEEPIQLENEYFTAVRFYSKEGAHRETRIAFRHELVRNTLTITVGTHVNEINLLEGALSATLDFYSYFGGKLYFYSDSEKQNLLGSYECDNTNNVVENTRELDKCFIALDRNEDNNDMVTTLNRTSITPIINNRFVFVRDALALAGESSVQIRLVDLSGTGNRRVIDQYVSVNTYSPANQMTPFHVQNNALMVIARNRNNKFIAFNVGATGISPVVRIEYDSLERLGDNNLLGRRDGRWNILNLRGEVISGNFNNQIRGFRGNWVKTMANRVYQISSMDGNTTLTTSNLAYVELYDTVFAGINSSNQLNIYRYDDPGTPLLANNVQLNSTSFFGVSNPAFTVRITGANGQVLVDGAVVATFSI